MRDLKNNIDVVHSLAPQARTATANGAGVDLQGFDSAVAVFYFGAWTDGTHTPKIQESDDNSVFTDVAAAEQIGSLAAISSAAGNNSVQRAGYLGRKRYIRTVLTLSGATTGAVSAAAVARSHAAIGPVA